MRAYLQSLIEDHQRVNEDLSRSNDDLLSGNEELQSLNEEMETAKEELQSTNEELNSVNDELQSRNSELGQANNDLINILASVEIPILILDAERRLRRFTPKARSIMNVLPTDIGRPIEDIRPNVDLADLDTLIGEAVESNTIREKDVKDRAGRWHRLQIRPYKTTDNRIDGAVLTLMDIDALKRAVTIAEWARDYARDIVESVPIPLMVLDAKISVLSANAAFYRSFGGTPEETEGRSLYSVGGGMWSFSELEELLGDLLPRSSRFEGIEVARTLANLGPRVLSLSAHPILRGGAQMPMILLAIEDVTDQRRLEAERLAMLASAEQAKISAQDANHAKDMFLAVLSHELRTPLNTLVLQSQILRRASGNPAKVARAADAIERAAKTQARLIEDLLDISRIVTGKLKMTLTPLDLAPSSVPASRPSRRSRSRRAWRSKPCSTSRPTGSPATPCAFSRSSGTS